jgi:hypothetical protein
MTKRIKTKKLPGDSSGKPASGVGLGGTGGVGGGGGEEVKERMTEVDKEWYQIQIKSLEERLQRRSDKMKQLEQVNSEYLERYF